MSFYTFNEETAKAADVGMGSKVLESGVYDVTINTVSKAVATTGTIGMDFNFLVAGQKFPNSIYGLWILKSDGTRIFNMDKIDALMGIAGTKALTEYAKTIDIKGGTKSVTAFKEFDGIKCKLVVQKIFDVYQGEVKDKNEIVAFLDEDGRTYAEKVTKKPANRLAYYETLKDKETTEYKKHMAEFDDIADTAANVGVEEDDDIL